MSPKAKPASLTIKDWAEDDRPRERLRNQGARQLSNAELIAILLGSGTKAETAVDVSKRILTMANNDLKELGGKTFTELTQIKGIGQARAITILAAMELGRRLSLEKADKPDKISSVDDVVELLVPHFSDLQHEEFWVLLLNRGHRVLEKVRVGQGGVSATVVDLRIITKLAINSLASSVIVTHNHPSGNLAPSESDKRITAKLKEALALFDIALIDHIIIASTGYYSFAEEGII